MHIFAPKKSLSNGIAFVNVEKNYNKKCLYYQCKVEFSESLNSNDAEYTLDEKQIYLLLKEEKKKQVKKYLIAAPGSNKH